MRFWGVKGFHLYKSFSFTATESPERMPRQLLVKLDPTKIWLRKTCIFSYIKIWRKAAQAVDLASLLPLPVALKRARSFYSDIFTHRWFCFSECSNRRWRKFVQEKTVYFIYILINNTVIAVCRERVPFNINPFMHFKTQQWTSPSCLCFNFGIFSV